MKKDDTGIFWLKLNEIVVELLTILKEKNAVFYGKLKFWPNAPQQKPCHGNTLS